MKALYKRVIISIFTLSIVLAPVYSIAKNEQKHKIDKHHKNHKPSSLPYGLQKKVAKGEPLPPGWQKKLNKGDILSEELFSHGKIHFPIDKQGNITLDIDGSLIKLHDKTRKILDIITD